MRTLNIAISDLEFSKFKIRKNKLTFTDFLDLISTELSKQNLTKSIDFAEKYGLSKMTMSEINKEVKAYRKNAENNS